MKTFMIINLSFFGDVILTGQLCADIKENFPESKIIFLTNKPFTEAAEYIPYVDETFYFDKKSEHKGLMGLIKFVRNFKYRDKIDTAITIYGNDRGLLLSWLLGAKNRIAGNKGIMNLFTTHVCPDSSFHHMSDANAEMLKVITNKNSSNKDIAYIPSTESQAYIKDILSQNGYDKFELIGLSTLSKKPEKDWSSKETAEFINMVNNSGKRVVLTGTNEAKPFVKELKKYGTKDFLDLTGKTSIVQLGALTKECRAFVSVDTASRHLAYATRTPTLCLFFIDNIKKWGPKNTDKNSILLSPKGISAKQAYEELEKLLERTG